MRLEANERNVQAANPVNNNWYVFCFHHTEYYYFKKNVCKLFYGRIYEMERQSNQ